MSSAEGETAPNDQATAPGGAAPNAAPASRNTSLGIEGGTAELSVRAAFADGYRIAPSSGFERGSFDDWANGHGNCPLNRHDVVIVTTSRAERVGQRLDQDAWDQEADQESPLMR